MATVSWMSTTTEKAVEEVVEVEEVGEVEEVVEVVSGQLSEKACATRSILAGGGGAATTSQVRILPEFSVVFDFFVSSVSSVVNQTRSRRLVASRVQRATAASLRSFTAFRYALRIHRRRGRRHYEPCKDITGILCGLCLLRALCVLCG